MPWKVNGWNPKNEFGRWCSFQFNFVIFGYFLGCKWRIFFASPKKGAIQKERIVFQLQFCRFFRGHVGFRQCRISKWVFCFFVENSVKYSFSNNDIEAENNVWTVTILLEPSIRKQKKTKKHIENSGRPLQKAYIGVVFSSIIYSLLSFPGIFAFSQGFKLCATNQVDSINFEICILHFEVTARISNKAYIREIKRDRFPYIYIHNSFRQPFINKTLHSSWFLCVEQNHQKRQSHCKRRFHCQILRWFIHQTASAEP